MKPIGEMFGTLLVVLYENLILNREDIKRITGIDFKNNTEIIEKLKNKMDGKEVE